MNIDDAEDTVNSDAVKNVEEQERGSPAESISSISSISSIASIKSDESYCHNQGDTNWCAAYTSAKLLARLLTKDNEGYKQLGKCFLDNFTQYLDRKSSFPYEYLYQFVDEINSRTFEFEDPICNELYNIYVANSKFKIVKSETHRDIIQAFDLKPKIPKILSIHGTKHFYEILESYKINENSENLEKYNLHNSVVDKLGHSLYVTKYNKETKKLTIKDTDGYLAFKIPLNLLLPSIKFVITIKKINKNNSTAKGIKKTKKNKTKRRKTLKIKH